MKTKINIRKFSTRTFTIRNFVVFLLVLALNMATVIPVADAMAVSHRPAAKTLVNAQPAPSRISVRMFQASQSLEVQYDSDRDVTAKVVITNIIGKQVQITSIEMEAGENLTKIDVGNLPQGTYIVQVVGSGWVSEARKFVKANP